MQDILIANNSDYNSQISISLMIWYEIWFRTSKLIQKRVIYRHKSPFNFIFEPKFSIGSAFGEPGGTRTHDTKLKRLVL